MKTILLIEDEEEVCRCIRDLLEREYKVLTTYYGKDGLNILNEEKVSLVILDYKLPDIDGLEVLSEMRRNHKIPVIVITAYGDREVILKSWRYKVDYYFDKPFKLRDLREKVEELLKSPNDAFPFNVLSCDLSKLSPHIRGALEFIGSTISNVRGSSKKITLKEISAAMSFTPKHLSRLFKKEFGQNASQIINIIKLERAKELLKNKEKDIKEIAFELGYYHPTNFARFIRGLTGKSPSELRKKTT